jgi:hypothetical protein
MLKNINPNKDGPPPRSAYDIKMMEKYNPLTPNSVERYCQNCTPDILPRTNYDKKMQKEWCHKCNKNQQQKTHKNIINNQRTSYDKQLYKTWYNGVCSNSRQEKYIKSHGRRKSFDERLQKRWCHRCQNNNYKEGYCGCRLDGISTLDDNDNVCSHTFTR